MRFSIFACFSILVGTSALTIPLETRDKTDNLSFVSRDILRLSQRSSFDDHELVDRSPFYNNKLEERSQLNEEELVGESETDKYRTTIALGKTAAKTKSRNGLYEVEWWKKKSGRYFKRSGKAPAKHDWSRKGAQPGQKVFWTPTARKQLDKLGLHGKARKDVKKFHVKTAKKAMASTGATSAKIYQIVHKNSSPLDKKMHITGKLYKSGNIPIPPAYTPPSGKAPVYHHMYTPSNDPKDLPTALKNAVMKQGKNLDQI